LMGVLQWGQWEPGQIMDSSFGSLKIQTFRKLPTIAPKITEIMCHIIHTSNDERRTINDEH
jgi:hypothetical protein